MDRIAAEGWKCLREGERDDLDSRVLSQRECAARDDVGQPYSVRASISYETHNFDAAGKLRSFDLDVITTAVARKGQHVTHQNTTDALIKAFETTHEHIWQGHPEQLQEAIETFNHLKPQCASPAGRTIEGISATTPSGFEISCWAGGMNFNVGDTTTYGQSLKIQPA